MSIRVLSPLLVNQIAAGEVIERPASVVKELVENSLDAGATRIDIVIEDGGRELVRVSDNGRGIDEDELHLAVTAHATSKIERPEDLSAIGTMGFRGEALASIASVSRLRIMSRATLDDGRPADSGAVIEATGDDIGLRAPAACAPGTIVEVRDLFYNTPARRKFMRGASAEFGHIADVVSRVAMARPGVAFKLTHNDRVTMDLPATDSRRARCIAVLGRDLDEALIEFESQHEWGSVWGLAGLPAIARATSKFQYLCLNCRPIRDRNLAHAIREAYRGLMPPDQHAVAVVCIEIDPQAVDVNVHPAKTEVRLREPSMLHGAVLAAIRQRLLSVDLTPRAPIASARPSHDDDTTPGDNGHATGPVVTDTQAFVEYFQRMNPVQKGFVYEQVRAAMDQEAESPASSTPPPPSVAPQPATEPAVLQVHKSYLVTQDEQGLVIIDQHALHERVMFEELSRRVLGQNQPLESQRLLMPATLTLSPQRMAMLESLAPLLERIGIEVAPMGPDTAGIHAFPSFLFDRKVEPTQFLTEMLDKAEDDGFDVNSPTSLEAALHEVLDMMACKAAVKAGDRMNPEELASLLAKRDQIERSSSCPHGRPTAIRLTLRDLEKHFKRV